jgi:hypothetical protein
MKPKTARILYFLLLIVVCVARYFELAGLSPLDVDAAPGEGMIFYLDIILFSVVAVFGCLLWSIGFAGVRFRKTTLAFGLLIIEWPLLLLIFVLCAHGFCFITHLCKI